MQAVPNKVYKIIDTEFVTKDFKVGDLVVSVDDDDVPFCVRLESFNGSMDLSQYNSNDYACFFIEQLEAAKVGNKSMFRF